MSTVERLRLHHRAILVLTEIQRIEDTVKAFSQEWFERQAPADQEEVLEQIETTDRLGFEAEARLALFPLKPTRPANPEG
jgi:hypothetical protein